MKNIITSILVLLSLITFAQSKFKEKTFSTAHIEFINPNKVIYDYATELPEGNGYKGGTDEIANPKISFGLTYNFNYMLFKKLSIGLLTGYQNHGGPKFSMVKLGGTLKFYFVDKNNVNIYIDYANNFSLNKKQFSNGSNARLGMSFPIARTDNFDIYANVFTEQNFLRMKNSEPLFFNEIPDTTTFKSLGLSIGAKF